MFSTPFDFFGPFTYPLNSQRVVVISDSDYKKYQQERAQTEILVLESKANRYQTALTEIETEINKIKKTHGLLPAASSETE